MFLFFIIENSQASEVHQPHSGKLMKIKEEIILRKPDQVKISPWEVFSRESD